jgi:hypothetical protein
MPAPFAEKPQPDRYLPLSGAADPIPETKAAERTGTADDGYWFTPLAMYPPSITRTSPVTNEEASDTR